MTDANIELEKLKKENTKLQKIINDHINPPQGGGSTSAPTPPSLLADIQRAIADTEADGTKSMALRRFFNFVKHQRDAKMKRT